MAIDSSLSQPAGAAAGSPAAIPSEGAEHTVGRFLRNGLLFVAGAVFLYILVYAASDQLVYQYAKRNRFYNIRVAPLANYDTVILGASHAAVFDYADMNAELEAMTGKKIINLSVVGSGVVVNRLLMDYFLMQHRTRQVIYVADSFAFYSRDWNEDRLQDVRLLDRAPFDPALVQLLWQTPASRSIALDYTLGFSKINNPDRFKPDLTEDEATRFDKTYRPVKQIDTQRISYLYPKPVDYGTFLHYLGEFETMVRDLQARGIEVVVVKPPLPQRMYDMLPDEATFDAALKPLLERNSVRFYDYSLVNNDEKFFFNSDHLNRTGVLAFFDGYLEQLVKP